jgi:SAM-dependent methyltransferase
MHDYEEKQIIIAYARRAERKRASNKFFCYNSLSHMCRVQERHRETLSILKRFGYQELAKLRILDVGCGDGNMLRQFMQWGAIPEHLAGIELRREPVEHALLLNPNVDVRCGSAVGLPWLDALFDLVCLHTVFTSILNSAMKCRIAAEINRVLRDGGAVLWYDFMYDNLRNPDVRGVKAKEIQTLFSGFEIHLKRITLAPPIERCLPKRLLPVLYPMLSAIPLLHTSYLGLLIKPMKCRLSIPAPCKN